jgi:hypothetical protein
MIEEAPMTMDLRPVERRVLAMKAAGLDLTEIGRRLNRSPEHVSRIIEWSAIPRQMRPRPPGLRPIERRLLKWRDAGLTHDEIGRRFRRSADHMRRVEGMAHYRMALQLLP